MVLYTTAREVISPNQEAVVVFTHGDNFFVDALGNGYTGNWVVNPDNLEDVDKVIVYLRRDGANINRIFLGNYAGCRKSPEAGRQEIRFNHLQEIGMTYSNWIEFAGGQNPVAYARR